jgi:hypothetical protein
MYILYLTAFIRTKPTLSYWFIVHGGGRVGFISDALLIYKSRQKTGDYHSEMGIKNYSCWLKTMLIPSLSPNSMHLSSYCTIWRDKLPASNSKKDKIKFLLLEINIQFF